jgi:hypothetical protein
MARQLAVTKRVSLAGIAEDWDDDCYALVTPMSIKDYRDFDELKVDGMTEAKAAGIESQFVLDHFVSGRVKILKDDGSLESADMVPEDVTASIDICNKLFYAISGILDPKDFGAAASSSEQPEKSSNITEAS